MYYSRRSLLSSIAKSVLPDTVSGMGAKRIISMLKRRRVELVLFCAVFLSAAWFYNGANANQISRYDMIFSFVEPGTPDTGTFRINHFIEGGRPNTIDWARNPKHNSKALYSNKAPGVAMLGIPVYWILYHLEVAMQIKPTAVEATYVNSYLINLVVTVLPIAISAVFFYLILLRFILPKLPFQACVLTISLYFGTLLLPFSTQLWGHSTATAFAVMALYFALHDDSKSAIASGLLLGLAVLCDYSITIILIGVAVFIGRRSVRQLVFWVLGGLPFAVIHAVYHLSCFGSLLPATSFNNPQFHNAEMTGGMFGGPSLEAIWGLSFSPYRGLFNYMPALLGVLLAIALFNRLRRKPMYWMAIFVVVAFFLMNASFNGWHGGMSTGPRYLIPALPFVMILIALAVASIHHRKLQHTLRWHLAQLVFVGLTFVSISHMYVITTQTTMALNLEEMNTPQAHAVFSRPIRFLYVSVKQGNVQPMRHNLIGIRRAEAMEDKPRFKAFNLGELIGLQNQGQLASFALLLLALATGVAAAAFSCSPESTASAAATPSPRSGADTQNSDA